MKYGRIAADNKEPFLAHGTRVFVDGEDITTHCFEADDIRNYALVYERNNYGQYFTTPNDNRPGHVLAHVRLTGKVEILLGPRESARRIRAAARAEVCSPLLSV